MYLIPGELAQSVRGPRWISRSSQQALYDEIVLNYPNWDSSCRVCPRTCEISIKVTLSEYNKCM